jgi:hypothetical protein
MSAKGSAISAGRTAVEERAKREAARWNIKEGAGKAVAEGKARNG